MTERIPKCLLPVGGRTILEWQLRGLISAGIHDITLVTGFQADKVEAAIQGIAAPGLRIRTVFNPFFSVSENIGSCFLVRDLLQASETVLLNGDTLFEAAVLHRLLAAPAAPVTVTIDRKAAYDTDDMKVTVDGTRLRAIGKTLPASETHGESIGMLRFLGEGGGLFAAGLEAALRKPEGFRRWYLSVIQDLAQIQDPAQTQDLAQTGVVQVASIEGLPWAEVDYPADLATAEALVRSWEAAIPAAAGERARTE